MKAEELAVIKERAENTSIVGEPYVKGDPWKGYEIIDEHNRMTIAELACGATADFFASAPSDIAKLLAEVERYQKYIETLKHVYWNGTDYELEQMIIRGMEDE